MADGFRFLDGETASTFEAAVHAGAARILDGLVAAYRKSHPEIEERYTRAVIGGAMISVGLAESRRIGLPLAEMQRKIAEVWATGLASEGGK